MFGVLAIALWSSGLWCSGATTPAPPTFAPRPSSPTPAPTPPTPAPSAPPAPPGDPVPGRNLVKQWKANVTARNDLGQHVTIETFYDGLNKRIRERSDSAFTTSGTTSYIPTDKLLTNRRYIDYLDEPTYNEYNLNVTSGSGDDASCRIFSQNYSYTDPFAIAEFASVKNGSLVIGGEPCEIWSGSASVLDVSVCIARDGVPRQMNTSIASTKQLLSTMTWSNVVAGPLPEEVFAPSRACANRSANISTDHGPQACEEAGSVKLDVYRVHSVTEPLSLNNKNVADSLGELGFVSCGNWWGEERPCDHCGNFGAKGTVVSWWQVEVSQAFGGYAACRQDPSTHENKCDVASTLVGRSPGLGHDWPLGAGRLGLDSGRCTRAWRPGVCKDACGSWYSLPLSGRCADGQPVGTNGCSWGHPQRVRTVDSTCIVQARGLFEMCARDTYNNQSLSKAVAIFAKALRSDDPTRGGCPDIPLLGEILV